MSELPRLNGAIRTLETGGTAFTTFASAEIENAVGLASSGYDGIIFEMEHNPFDVKGLRDSLQFLLNRLQIVEGGTLAPTVTPLVRIPPNGGEMNQWLAKQVLDTGPERLGLMTTISGVGSLLGSLVIASLPNRSRGRNLLASSLLLGVALLQMGERARPPPLSSPISSAP